MRNLIVSGTTLLNGTTTINSTLTINTSTTNISPLLINASSTTVLLNIIQNTLWNNNNYAINITGYSNFGGLQINGQAFNTIYQPSGDLTIASPSLNNIIFKTNYGT